MNTPPRDLEAMNGQFGEQPDNQLRLLHALIEEHATIAGDIIEVGADTWAIHGSIAVDGEVLIAEYDSLEEARSALDRVPCETTEPPLSDGPAALDEIVPPTSPASSAAHQLRRGIGGGR
jgi:hypothetical protein